MITSSDALAAAIAQHEADTRHLKDAYAACVKSLATAPTDKALHAEIARLSAELAAVGAGLSALRQAHDDAVETERKTAADVAKAAAKQRVATFVESVKARRVSYDRLQQAADDFLRTLRQHVDGGEPLCTEALQIASGLYGPRAGDHAGPLSDAAAGRTGRDAAAIAHILKRAVDIMGRGKMEQFVALNDFMEPVMLCEAHELAVRTARRVERA